MDLICFLRHFWIQDMAIFTLVVVYVSVEMKLCIINWNLCIVWAMYKKISALFIIVRSVGLFWIWHFLVEVDFLWDLSFPCRFSRPELLYLVQPLLGFWEVCGLHFSCPVWSFCISNDAYFYFVSSYFCDTQCLSLHDNSLLSWCMKILRYTTEKLPRA